MLNRKRIDVLVVSIAWLAAAAILLVFILSGTAHSAPNLQKARLTGGQAIDRAADAWKTIYDYQSLLHQTETHPNGEVKEFWARVRMVRPIEEKKDLAPAFSLEMFDRPISMSTRVPQDATPTKIYFADGSELFYTVNPSANTISIEKLNERTSPLPEFMYLAGFMDFNIEEFKEKAYIDSDVYQEEIDEVDTYKIRIQPRKEIRDVEPPRFLWIDRKTSLPKQFAVESDVVVNVKFQDTSINQGLNSEDLIPEVREDAVRDFNIQEN